MPPLSLVDNVKPRQSIAPLIEWFGHSYIFGTGVLTDADTIRGIASRELAADSLNRGSGGQKLADSVGTPGYGTIFSQITAAARNRVAAPFIGPDRAYATLWGINEIDGNTPAAHFARAARVAISRLRTCTVAEHTDASVAFTGAWTARTTTSNRASANDYNGSSTATNSVDINLATKFPAGFPGGVVGLGFVFKNGLSGAVTDAGDWTVQHNAGAGFVNSPRADGAAAGVHNQRGITDAPLFASSVCSDVARFVIPAGATTIKATLAAVTGEAGFDYYQLEAPTDPPKVLWGLCPRIGVYTAVTGTPVKATGDQRVMDQNAAVRALLAAEFTDGRVTIADVDAAWDGTYASPDGEGLSMTGVDNLHPSVKGSRAAAMAYLTAAGVRAPALRNIEVAPSPRAASIKLASTSVAAGARFTSASAGYDLHRILAGSGSASSGQPVLCGRVRVAVQADVTASVGKLAVEFSDDSPFGNVWMRVAETSTAASTSTAGVSGASALRAVDTFILDVPVYARYMRIVYENGNAAAVNIIGFITPINI